MLIEFIKPGVKSIAINELITVAIGDIVDVPEKQAEFFIEYGHAKHPTPVKELDFPWLDVDDKILGYLSVNEIHSIDYLITFTKQQLIDMPKLGKSSVNKIINALGDDYVLATD